MIVLYYREMFLKSPIYSNLKKHITSILLTYKRPTYYPNLKFFDLNYQLQSCFFQEQTKPRL